MNRTLRKIARRTAARLAVRLPEPHAALVLHVLGYPPIAGAEDPPAPTPPAPAPTPPAPAPAPAPAPTPPAPGGTYTPPDEQAWSNTQRQLREATEERDRLKSEQEERERKAAEEAGNHQQLYEAEKKKREEAERKATEAEQARVEEQQRIRVERIATRLKFRDPEDVLHRLSDDDRSSDEKVEKALKKLADEKSYLIEGAGNRNQGGAGGGGGGAGGSSEANADEVFGETRLSKAYGDSS
jgi:colicin import membrane protein